MAAAPLPSKQKKDIESKESHFKELEKGDKFFAIPKKWYQSWAQYVDEPNAHAPPGPIDTRIIADSVHGGLKETDCQEDQDYVVKSNDIWQLFKKWYGIHGREIIGEVQVNRRGEAVVEFTPIRFQVSIATPSKKGIQDANSEDKFLVLSRHTPIADLKKHVDHFCEKDIKRAGAMIITRLWIGDPSSNALQPFDQSDPNSSDTIVDEFAGIGIWKVLLEMRRENDEWPFGDDPETIKLPQDQNHDVGVIKSPRPSLDLRQRTESFTRDHPVIGQRVDAKRKRDSQWLEAKIVSVNDGADDEIKVHFLSFPQSEDEIYGTQDQDNIAQPYTHVLDWRSVLHTDEEIDISRELFKDEALTSDWLVGKVRKCQRSEQPSSNMKSFTISGQVEIEIITGMYSKKSITVDLNSEFIAKRYTHLPKPKKPSYGTRGEEGHPRHRGIVGIRNLGNTCYMNSMLQCLAHTQPIGDYFLTGNFEKEINTENPLGTGGELSESFASFLRDIWGERYRVVAPGDLKTHIGRVFSQFQGYQQQDSHEFFSLLVDAIHEDQNRILKKPYTEAVESNNRPDELVAQESWDTFKLRNDSVVVDSMMGQLKSHLTCPECGEQATKFDPYSNLTVPIPQLREKTLRIVYRCNRDNVPSLRRLSHTFPATSATNIHAIADWCSQKLDVDKSELVIFTSGSNHTKNNSIYYPVMENATRYSKKFDITNYNDEDIVVVRVSHAPCDDPEIRCNTLIELRYANPDRDTTPDECFLLSDFFYQSDAMSGEDLYLFCWRKIEWLFGDGSGTPSSKPAATEMEVDEEVPSKYPFTLKRESAKNGYESKPIPMSGERWRKKDVCIYLEFTPEGIERSKRKQLKRELLNIKGWENKKYGIPDFTVDEEPMRSTFSTRDSTAISLDDCLEKFREEEQLGEEDEWYCPKCKDHVKAFKQMSIWSVPKILVIHLKRFYYEKSKYVKNWVDREKITDLVTFPLQGLDITRFVGDNNSGDTEPKIYDLYAVSNHIGGMGGGHYTAYVKYQKDSKDHNDDTWFCMNDSHYDKASSEDNVVSSQAYVLFYERREA